VFAFVLLGAGGLNPELFGQGAQERPEHFRLEVFPIMKSLVGVAGLFDLFDEGPRLRQAAFIGHPLEKNQGGKLELPGEAVFVVGGRKVPVRSTVLRSDEEHVNGAFAKPVEVGHGSGAGRGRLPFK